MREAQKTQPSLRENWLELDHAREMQTISELLDGHRGVEVLALQDLRSAGTAGARHGDARGAGGLSAEQVVRMLLVKQMNGFSYRALAFHLADSRTFHTFCRLGITDKLPSKSALNANFKALKASTLEAINRLIVGAAVEAKVEAGRTVRVDCTVVASNIHEPRDSELLWDCVRVVVRLMRVARKVLGVGRVAFGDRTRRAKRRRKEITNAKSREERLWSYRDLMVVTDEVCSNGQSVLDLLRQPATLEGLDLMAGLQITGVAHQLAHYLPLAQRVLDQTRRRVIQGQRVPALEKIVSIFEEHTDIIRKDNRETHYGHKICLTGGASSMILDCSILKGNPADSTLAKSMAKRQTEIFARPPRQIVFDGGFASKLNLQDIKAAGVKDVAFSKSLGLEITAMVKSRWVFKRLRDFRAGIEGNISFLKRIFGLDRCTWRTWESFQAYVWASILSFNLLVLARHHVRRVPQ
jgi:IS5 family transposase